MRRVRILPALVLSLIVTGCSMPPTVREQGIVASDAVSADTLPANVEGEPAPRPAPPKVAVPASPVARSAAVVASPMYVWVPQWGVYVVEGQDIVYHDGYYYYWYGGRWYVARTHRGPWTYATDFPPALANLPPGHFDRHLPPGLEKKPRPQPSPTD